MRAGKRILAAARWKKIAVGYGFYHENSMWGFSMEHFGKQYAFGFIIKEHNIRHDYSKYGKTGPIYRLRKRY